MLSGFSGLCMGAEPTYAGVTMSKLMEGDQCVGDVISLLWFKRQLPKCVHIGLALTHPEYFGVDVPCVHCALVIAMTSSSR